MSTLDNAKRRVMEDISSAMWFDNPEKYPYVREADYMCSSKNYIPIKSKEKKLKLIGYTIPKKVGEKIYVGTFWYLICLTKRNMMRLWMDIIGGVKMMMEI
jgi:hypothetical protein